MNLKVALTHDVDRICKTYQFFSHGLKNLFSGDLGGVAYQIKSYKKRNILYWNFEDILKIEDDFGIKSTFYFLDESIPFNLFSVKNWKLSLGRYDIFSARIQSMIRYLVQNGWEIGLHGSYLSYGNKDLLRKEKEKLESITGQSVIGIRQHYLNLNSNTWLFQRDVGFKYDSSWGYTTRIGFKENRKNHFHPFNDHFVVFPMIIMDAAYMMIPENCRISLLLKLIDDCQESNCILVINWHSNNFNEQEYPGFKKSYIEIIETCLKRNANFNTLNNFYNKINREN